MTAGQPNPLRMAENCAAAVLRVADWQETDPLQTRVHEAGRMGKESAELGACMALVSIAQSLHRLVTLLETDSLGRRE
jgi:hypothetical protein